MVLAGGVQSSAKVVGLLRRPIIGMAEERLGNPDMRRIADRQLGRNNLAKQMRIDIAAEFALGDRADAFADLLAGERPAPITDPERVYSPAPPNGLLVQADNIRDIDQSMG